MNKCKETEEPRRSERPYN